MPDKVDRGAEQAALEREQMRAQREHDLKSRGLYLTETEWAKVYALEDKYSPLIGEAFAEEQAAAATRPDISAFYQGISPEANPDDWEAAQLRAADAVRAWEAHAPREWKDAQARIADLTGEVARKVNAVYKAAHQRQLEGLGSEPGEIVQRAKEQADRLIADQYEWYKEAAKRAYSMSAFDLVALGGKEWKLDAAETRNRISKALKPLHFKALGDNTAAIDEIKAYIEKAILGSPYIAPEGTPGTFEKVVFREGPDAGGPDEVIPGMKLKELTPDFIYGEFAIMPISRAIQEQRNLANNEKAKGRLNAVWIGGAGEESANVFIKITTEKELTPEAVEIQNAIGEMIQANGNKPINVTWAQLWRAFAILDDGAWVSDKNQEYTRDIVRSLAAANGRIDFTQQIEKHKGIKKDPSYDYSETKLEGPLVMRDEIRVMAGGHETGGATFYRQPLFFMHSQLTGQITRIDRTVLNTTSKKIVDAQGNKHTVETKNNDLGFILLKRHLARQIEHMKKEKETAGKYEGRRSFESIIKALGDKQLTPKQRRTLRENIDLLCARWKMQGYIKDYELYKARGGKAFTGVKIEI